MWSVEEEARAIAHETLGEEKLPKVVIMRIMSFLTLTELIDKGLQLSQTWRRLLTTDKITRRMLRWTHYQRYNLSYRYNAVSEEDIEEDEEDDDKMTRRDIHRMKLRKKKLVMHLNSKYEELAENGTISFKKIELLVKLSEVVGVEVDYKTFKLM